MKHNWTYRPFMECIENVKYTTKLQTKDFAQQGTYPVISQDESFISGYWDNADDVFHAKRPLVIFGDHTRVLKYINFDFVLGADGVKILLPTEDIIAKYMYYYLKWYNVPSLGYSRHFKLLRDIELPIPSLFEQQSIVRELDAISDIIAAKNAQLRELDALAQALFYDIFGDPITNPKGWPVKKLGEISTLLNGRAYSKNELLNKGKYRILRVGNFFTNDSWYYSDLELDADKYCDKGDLLFAWSASFCARIWEGEKVIYHYHIWKVLCDETQLDKVFYCHLLNNMLESMKKDTHGTGMVHLTKIGMEQYYLPLPPLDLQQTFAAQIEAIEQQKALIRRSLDDTRTLLAARMQYYFE